jgi:hypothetical protein
MFACFEFMASAPFIAGKQYKLCKDCRHFKPPPDPLMQLKNGFCTKEGKVNLVDGATTYQYAEITRVYTCKEKWWEPQNK